MNIVSKVRAGIIGASGYTGSELVTLLSRHPEVELVFATSRSHLGKAIPGTTLEYSDPAAIDPGMADVVFLALPHGEAARWVVEHGATAKHIIDLTGDHRPGSGREEGWTFGLPDLFPERLRAVTRISNPGCYPTGVILSLHPLLAAGVVEIDRPIVVNAASGTTGAGRSLRADLLFSEVFGEYRAYGLGNGHRHLLEMRALLPSADLLFVPHLLPVARGILETIAVPVRDGVDAGQVRALWSDAYDGKEGIELLPDGHSPTLSRVAATDRIVLSVVENPSLRGNLLTVLVAFDNLGKGAAGQAIQNLNGVMGWPLSRGMRI